MALRRSITDAANNVAQLAENLNDKTHKTDELLVLPLLIGLAIGIVVGTAVGITLVNLVIKR